MIEMKSKVIGIKRKMYKLLVLMKMKMIVIDNLIHMIVDDDI